MTRKARFLLGLPRRVWRSLSINGLVVTAEIAWHRFHEQFCDWRLGIDTLGFIDLELGPSRHEYEGTDYRLLSQMFSLVRELEEGVVFLDYGCGKGRAVVLAAMRPFQKVIGVELDDGMLDLARRNIARLQKRMRCPNVSLVNADATQFDVPDDVNVVFMFNPFGGEVRQAVIHRIEASLHRLPRRITIFFLYPPDFTTDPFPELDWCTWLTEIPVARHRSLRFPVYQTSLSRSSNSQPDN